MPGSAEFVFVKTRGIFTIVRLDPLDALHRLAAIEAAWLVVGSHYGGERTFRFVAAWSHSVAYAQRVLVWRAQRAAQK